MKNDRLFRKQKINYWMVIHSSCSRLSYTTERVYFGTPYMPNRLFPAFFSFLLFLGISGSGECSKKEDFEFLNRTFDDTRLVNSGEDLVKSYSVFFLSTLASFEAHYWLFECIRKRLHPGSELNSYSPDIIEIASIWTAASVIQNGNYTDWPRNGVLHGFVKAGSILQTVMTGLLLERGKITIPALILVYISAESLAEMVSDTLTTLVLRSENIDPGKIWTEKYDILESSMSVLEISWLISAIAFEIITLMQLSSVKSVALYSVIVILLAAAVEPVIIYIKGTRLSILSSIKIGAVVITKATVIAIAIKILGVGIGAAIVAEITVAFGTICKSAAAAAAIDLIGDEDIAVTQTIAGTEIIAAFVTGIGVTGLFILAKSGPLFDTRYSRVAATIAVASFFAFVSSIANYLNKGIPLDETFSEISGFYWKKAFELVHTPIDYLWTVFYGGQ